MKPQPSINRTKKESTLQEYHSLYRELGLSVIPIEWDMERKEPKHHPEGWADVKKIFPLFSNHNALMVKTCNGYGCLDFDLKNTQRKTIYEEWRKILINQWPELFDKLYVEATRSCGYHVWFKYSNLPHKTPLAQGQNAEEIIALYANGPGVYTYPTPGYSEIHSSMTDLVELTKEEYEYLISSSEFFNEYKPPFDPNKKAVSYPKGHEAFLNQFDSELPDEAWIKMLNQIGLAEIDEYRYNKKDKFRAYKRIGSETPGYSAKVYFKKKRAMIFSSSMQNYPNYHSKEEYSTWSLPPSFVLFYKNNRNWDDAIKEMKCIAESIGMELDANNVTGGRYPLEVFPAVVAASIKEVSEARSIPVEFIATAALWTVSSLSGTMYHSPFGNEGKNILFCLLVAPVSVGKTPAYQVVCENPLKHVYEQLDKTYANEVREWKKRKAEASRKKKPLDEDKPLRYMPIVIDGTTEAYCQKSMSHRNGIGVFCDEAETIFNAGNFKPTNDSISFFTQAFSGIRVTQIRADENRDRVVPKLNLNLLMGTQPSRVKNVFTEDRLSSGFASRFLMVESDYIQLNVDADPFGEKKEMCREWVDLITKLFNAGLEFNKGTQEPTPIDMPDVVKDVYRKYHRQLMNDGNKRIESKAEPYILGTEAKMSAYFPRLVQIIAIMNNPDAPEITEEIVHAAWILYRYYANSTVKIISDLHSEVETGLPKDLELFYQSLPEFFTSKDATDLCKRMNINPRRFEYFTRRKDFSRLIAKVKHGQYKKL